MRHKTLIRENFPYEDLRGKDVLPFMSDLQDLLNSTNLNWWWSAGTVLGLVREKEGYILHDKDIDLEVEIKTGDEPQELIKLFNNEGYKTVLFNKTNNKNTQLVFLGLENMLIDIYFYYLEDELFINENVIGKLTIPKEYVDKKDYFNSNGIEFLIPQPYEDYLVYRYGDWKTPRGSKGIWYKDAGIALKKW